jgi:hypothetical protein
MRFKKTFFFLGKAHNLGQGNTSVHWPTKHPFWIHSHSTIQVEKKKSFLNLILLSLFCFLWVLFRSLLKFDKMDQNSVYQLFVATYHPDPNVHKQAELNIRNV